MHESRGREPLLTVPAARLFACGLAALYWELVLIRWLGSSIRVIAYYSNFVLSAAFFGLAVGALLAARRDLRLDRWIAPALALGVALGAALAGVGHGNPADQLEHVWYGPPKGIVLGAGASSLPTWGVLGAAYLVVALAFVAFGQWMGTLFKLESPLRAYSFEIVGSIAGILLFGALSWTGCSPRTWFVVGFALLLPQLERTVLQYATTVLVGALAVAVATPLAERFTWSSYYKIRTEPFRKVVDPERNEVIEFARPIGHALTVNDDYHQMILDLADRKDDHPFLASWRHLYDAPYGSLEGVPEGPILILGAGTGNDVSAALRRTNRPIHAVEIDPAIVALGRRHHFEHPYDSPRVSVFVDDARTFLETTKVRYALVVFGFLDSHVLSSSFASLRLDNYVYTRESLEQVKNVLLPGGRVYLTFASNTEWLDQRLRGLVDSVFDEPTRIIRPEGGFANGIVYANVRRADGARAAPGASAILLPTDDWPFLYLRERAIPAHYLGFMAATLVMGSLSLLLLPRGERRVRLPYFFLGAAFFLIETSNVVSLSLLFGSTWTVNLLVFTGILLLVLLGNVVAALAPRLPPLVVMGLLVASVTIAYVVPASALLGLGAGLVRDAAAIGIFLGPVFFSAVLFAKLVKSETNLTQAYGSNVLGAMVGGACEYLSLVAGFKALILLTLAFYVAACVLIRRDRLLAS